MPTDNVVPIDADAARVLARQPVRFRWFVGFAVAAWLGMLVPVLVLTPLPPLAPFLALAALIVLAEHRFVLFGDETSMSGSILVAVAAVFLFADSAPFAGPMLVASLGGLYLPHIRHRECGKMVINASSMCFGAFAACGVATVTSHALNDSFATQLSAATLVAVAYWCANNVAISAYVADIGGGSFRTVSKVLLSSDTSVLLWAITSGVLAIVLAERPGLCLVTVGLVTASHGYATKLQQHQRMSSAASTGPKQVLPWLLALCVLIMSEPNSAVLLVFLLAYLFDVSNFGPIETNFPLPIPLVAITILFAPSNPVGVVTCIVGVTFALSTRPTFHAFRFSLHVVVFSIAYLVLRADFGLGNVTVAAAAASALLIAYVIPRVLVAVRLRSQMGCRDAALLLGLAYPGRRETVAIGLCMLAASGLQLSLEAGAFGAVISVVAIGALGAAPTVTPHGSWGRAFR